MPERALRCLLSLQVFKASSSLHVGNLKYSVWNSVFHWAPLWITQQGPHIDLLDLRSTTGCLKFLPLLYERVMFPAENNVQCSDNIDLFLIAVILIDDILSILSIEEHVQCNNKSFLGINSYNKDEDFLKSQQIS